MGHQSIRKFISLLMVVILTAISLTGFCRDSHASEGFADSRDSHAVSYLHAIDHDCPCCPGDDHTVPDHCDSSCNCPCHAPLAVQAIDVVCSRSSSCLVFREPFAAIPEVYLPKFIPPHILA